MVSASPETKKNNVPFDGAAREKGSYSSPRRFRVFVLLCPAGRRSPPLLNMNTATPVPFPIGNAFRFPFGTRSVSHSERVPFPIWNAFRLSVWNNQIFQVERVPFEGFISGIVLVSAWYSFVVKHGIQTCYFRAQWP